MGSLRPNGVTTLAAINGPGAYRTRHGDDMAKKKKAKKPARAKTKRRSAPKRGPVRATLVKKRGGGATLRLRRNAGKKKGTSAAALRKQAEGQAGAAISASLAETKAANAKLRSANMRLLADSSRLHAAVESKNQARITAARKKLKASEEAYKKAAKATPQYRKVKKTKTARERIAFGSFKRYRSPRGLTYGYLKGGKVKRIPEWAIGGAHSKADYADSKYDKRRAGIAKTRTRVSKRVEARFAKTTKKLERQMKALKDKQARELKKIAEGKSIMSPNRKRRRKMKANGRKAAAKRATKRNRSKKKTVTRRTRVRTIYAAPRRKARGGKRKGSRKGKRRKAQAKGRIVISHTFSRGKKRRTKRTSFSYKAKRGRKGYVSVRLPTKRGKARHYNFTANRRRSVRRRKSFRRNGALDPVIAAIKTGGLALGGFGLHRVATGLLASAIGPSLTFLPEAAKVPVVGAVVAAVLAIAAKSVVKGEAGNLLVAGIGVSFLHQAAMAALRSAGQDGAASYLAGVGVIGTQRTTQYGGFGAYELVSSNPGMSGLGRSPYQQAAAGVGSMPYSQAVAGLRGMGANPFAGRGNYMDVPALGAAYAEQAMAGGAYPEQAAAGFGGGMGAYELTTGTFDGIGTDDRSIEKALDFADKEGIVSGFGDATIGRSNIMNPDGAQASISPGGELPMVSGIFGGSSLSVPFG